MTPNVNLLSPVMWWRYWCRFFSSFFPPSRLKNLGYRMTGIRIGSRAFIGESVYFVDGFQDGLIELADEAVLSPKVIVIAMASPGHSFLRRDYDVEKIEKVVIEEGAWIGAGAVILPGVTIGRGAIVGANSVVNKSIGALEIWGGIPAQYIKQVEYKR